MNDYRMIYDAFNIYYEKGMSALKNENFESAKRNLYCAAESMLKLAEVSEGELKAQRLKRSKELMLLAQEIEAKQRKRISYSDVVHRDIQRVLGNKDIGRDGDDSSEVHFEPINIHPNISLDDVAGLYEAKDAIDRLIIRPRKCPEIYKAFNKDNGGGILLYGVPGTGKTMIAQAIANEIDAKFFSVKCSDIVTKYFGEAEKNIKNLFAEARKYPNAIIFFDEFEAIGASRDTKSSVMKRIIPELLAQMQGFEKSENALLLIAATNRPWDIDSAFTRPGRFNNSIYVPLPDEAARKVIVEKNLAGVPVSESVNIDEIVRITDGFNGADVGEFCSRLKDFAIARSFDNGGIISKIDSSDVAATADVVHTSVRVEDLQKIENYRNNRKNSVNS